MKLFLLMTLSFLTLNAYETHTNKTTKNFNKTNKLVEGTSNYIRDDKKEVVIDRKRKLMWQDNENVRDNANNWKNAKAYCKKLEHADFNDWYLPSLRELQSIARPDSAPRAIIKVFKYNKPSYFWSSSENVLYNHYAWRVDFEHGSSYYYNKSYDDYVRCVRQGK